MGLLIRKRVLLWVNLLVLPYSAQGDSLPSTVYYDYEAIGAHYHDQLTELLSAGKQLRAMAVNRADSLGEHSQDISEILELIDNVADVFSVRLSTYYAGREIVTSLHSARCSLEVDRLPERLVYRYTCRPSKTLSAKRSNSTTSLLVGQVHGNRFVFSAYRDGLFSDLLSATKKAIQSISIVSDEPALRRQRVWRV